MADTDIESDTLPTSFATLSFHQSDLIRLLQFPPATYDPLAAQIRASWPPGIQAARPPDNATAEAYESKLRGRPFGGGSPSVAGGGGAAQAVGSRRLVRDVLAFLHSHGWVLVTPLGHCRGLGCRDTLVFRRRTRFGGGAAALGEPVVPPPLDWLVVTLAKHDRLRIIYDAPTADGVVGKDGAAGLAVAVASFSVRSDHDHDEVGLLIQSVKKAMAELDCFRSGEWKYESFEFKCKGSPWQTMGEKAVRAQLLILRVVETLNRFGWQSYAAVRQRGEPEDAQKADSWYFVRPRGWGVSGASAP